jgi:hypothetical protein
VQGGAAYCTPYGCLVPSAHLPARQPACQPASPPHSGAQPALLCPSATPLPARSLSAHIGRHPGLTAIVLYAGSQREKVLGQYTVVLAFLATRPEMQPQREALAADLETQRAMWM